MKNKPFIIFLFILLVFPMSGLGVKSFSKTKNPQTFSEYFKNLSKIIPQQDELMKTSDYLLKTRWTKPMESTDIINKLTSFGDEALLSFFNYNYRKLFIQDISSTEIQLTRVYKSIPAVAIRYNESSLFSIDFTKYEIKYAYHLGSKKYYAPQNVETDLSGRVQLNELRKALEIDYLHSLNYTGYGVTVAILDSGINESKAPGLSTLRNYDEKKIVGNAQPNEIEMGEDVKDYSGHGTNMASILAGNGLYIRDGKVIDTNDYGVAPDVKIYDIKVLDRTGFGEDRWLMDGFDEAINPQTDIDVNIISASLTSITFAAMDDPIEEFMYEAGRKGILVVASAGNYGPTGSSVGAPALWDNVISAGATKDLHDLTVFTSRGINQNFSSAVDILAPGSSIGGIDAGTGGYEYRSGTSVSVPIISGVLALLLQAFPSLPIEKYEAALLNTATDLLKPIIAQGVGLVNPKAAYEYLNQNKNFDLFSINPKRISPNNLYFYSCVEGEKTTYRVKIISSANQVINATAIGDNAFVEIKPQYYVTQGWNHISFNITIPWNTRVKNLNTKIRFFTSDITEDLEINIQTRYYGGTVLFDISHDNDTANNWFDSSTPYGMHSILSRRLKDRGFHVNIHSTYNSSYEDS
ncbi:MAG: S8 family peptidase, partial [Candidatus Heimdallarchaeaceae archaeon]